MLCYHLGFWYIIFSLVLSKTVFSEISVENLVKKSVNEITVLKYIETFIRFVYYFIILICLLFVYYILASFFLLHMVTGVSVSVAKLVNATVHATGTGGQTMLMLRFSSGGIWFAY